MKKLIVYVDVSVIGGLEDDEFSADSNVLWKEFISGGMQLGLSAHSLRELAGAPDSVRAHIGEIPKDHQMFFDDSAEAEQLAQAYLRHGVVGPGSHGDALHVALATVGGADVIVSWNFKHIVNFGRIKLFNAVNLENGYCAIEIRTPKEVLNYD